MKQEMNGLQTRDVETWGAGIMAKDGNAGLAYHIGDGAWLTTSHNLLVATADELATFNCTAIAAHSMSNECVRLEGPKANFTFRLDTSYEPRSGDRLQGVSIHKGEFLLSAIEVLKDGWPIVAKWVGGMALLEGDSGGPVVLRKTGEVIGVYQGISRQESTRFLISRPVCDKDGPPPTS